jgi:hypothetical protein
MSSEKKLNVAGWVLSAVVFGFLCFSASGKFIQPPEVLPMFEKLGYSTDTIRAVGYVEVVCAVLFLIPRLAFIGAILLTAYMGGATNTHVRIGDPWFFPVILGVVIWIAYGLRAPAVMKKALGLKDSA